MDTIIRVYKDIDADPFARIDKVPINDPKISYKALGILVYVLSKPDGWEVNITDLENHATDKDKAIRSGIAELLKYKYCQRVKIVDPETKRIKKWLLVFYERPYSGEIQELLTIISYPDTYKGNVDIDPDSPFPHVEKPHVEKPHVENRVLNNNRVNQLKKEITKENNNNNKAAAEKSAAVVVVEIPKKLKRKYSKIKNRALTLGWVGSTKELDKYFIEDPARVEAWIDKVEAIKGDIKNPAGLLRKGLRSDETPKTKTETERDKLEKLGLSKEEITALV